MATAYTSVESMAKQVQRLWSKGNPNRDFPYEGREIERVIRDKMHFEMKGEILTFRSTGNSWEINENYLATFILDVKISEEFGENYVDIPAAYMSIPGHRGFQSCRPWVKDKRLRQDMIILTPDMSSIIESLPAGSFEGLFACELAKGKVIFLENCGKTLIESGISKVRIKIVSMDPRAVDSDEQLFLPPEMRGAVVQATAEFFGPGMSIPKDQVANLNPDI